MGRAFLLQLQKEHKTKPEVGCGVPTASSILLLLGTGRYMRKGREEGMHPCSSALLTVPI